MRDRIRALRTKVETLLAYAEARLYLFITPKKWLSIYVKHEMKKIEKRSYLSQVSSTLKTVFEGVNSGTISTNSWKNALFISIGLVIFLRFQHSFCDLRLAIYSQ